MTTTIFQTLLALDVRQYTEKKGKFSYLSWSYAVAELRKHAPDATWTVVKYPLPDAPHVHAPYCITPGGCFVEVSVTVGGIALSQIHPVIDERNQTIKSPGADQVNKSIMRCLVKAIALHGLGLNVYAGEDLPLGDAEDAPPAQVSKPAMTSAQRANDRLPASAKSVLGAVADDLGRINVAKAAIAEQAKRLGIARDQIAAELRAICGGALPANSIEYEDALAVLKEMEAPASDDKAAE